MNPYRFKTTMAQLPDSAILEYDARQDWSVYRLPVWNVPKPVPTKAPYRPNAALAKVRAAHGQP